MINNLLIKYAIAAETCTLNGQIVPCPELVQSAKSFFGWGIGFVIFFLILFVLITAFWVSMLVHAIKNPIEHKPLWILIMLIAGYIGSLIYYFAVKKTFVVNQNITTPPPPSQSVPPTV